MKCSGPSLQITSGGFRLSPKKGGENGSGIPRNLHPEWEWSWILETEEDKEGKGEEDKAGWDGGGAAEAGRSADREMIPSVDGERTGC